MRKLFTSLTFLLAGVYSFSQCTNTTSYGSATAPSTVGTSVTISSCQYQTEYSTVSGLVAGNTYSFNYNLGGCITIHSGSSGGPIVASGNAPVSYTPTTGGTYYIHYNTNCGSCGTATSCGISTVTLTSGTGGGGGGACVGGANNSCGTADPFCTGTTYNYCNSTGVASMGTYGCLFSTPNPMWMYLNISTAGNIDIYIEQFTNSGTPIDVDFALYGPYSSLAAACPITTSTPTIDCSYSSAATETANITGATVGQWYMLLITNYANSAGYIEFSQTGGTGATNCSIVSPCPVTAAANTPLCAGQTLNLTATTITGATYSWSGPGGYTSSSQNPSRTNATTAMAGTYTVTVTAPGPCTSTSSVAVTINSLPAVTVTPTAITVCNGYPVTLTASGAGTYSWSPSTGLSSTTGSSVTATPSSTTTYTVTGTNSTTGCTNTATSTITVNPALSISVTPSAPSICSGNSVSLTASGATTYSWSPATGLSATSGATVTANPASTTTYTVTGSATNCDNASTTVTVTVNSTTSGFTYNGNQCLTGNSFNFSNTGAMGGGVTYSWTFPSGTPATSTSASPSNIIWSTAGTYAVSQTTTSGSCSSTTTQNITVYPQPAVTAIGTNPLCSGACNGSVSASGSGGTPGYTYTWSGALGSGTPKSGVCAGTYTVTVSDANGCTGINTVTLNNPAAIAGSASATSTGCNGACTGTLSASGSGGTSPYTYAWSGGLGTGSSKSSVCAGTFTVTITDNNGCTTTATATVNQPTSLTASASATNASCNGSCNGSLTASATGGTTGYTYSWSGGLGSGATKTGVCSGSYTVTATDANGCTSTATATVNQPPVLAVSPTSTSTLCNGACNGTVSASATGGTSAYSYAWSGGLGAGATKSGVCAGSYTVTVTDANGCTATGNVNVNQPASVTVSASGTNALCNGTCNGTLSASGSGGTTAYAYAWSGGLGSGSTKTGVCAGSYTVTITDVNGCTATNTATIGQPTAITVSATATPPTCNGNCNGTLNALGSGGTTAYTYAWSGGLGPGANKSGVCSGTYTVTVTDANGCTSTNSATVNQPVALTATALSTSATCSGTCNGTVTVSGSGGTTGYTYSWSGGLGIGQSASGACAGSYTVTVTDANGCTTNATTTVNQPTAIVPSATGTSVGCNGGTNGTATISATGGTGPYTYLWSNASTNASISGLTAGNYSVTVTDANGCTANTNYTVTQPTVISVTTSGTNANCNGASTGSATTSPSGGTSPYTYQWDGGTGFQTTQTATGLAAGTYNVTVTGTGGCTATSSVTINQPSAITATTSSTNAACGSPTGTATVTPAGGTSPYTFAWNTIPVQTSTTATGLMAGSYSVTVTDANTCSQVFTIIVSSAGAPTASITSSGNVNCNGGNNGTATVSASGGATPYSYAWSPSGGSNAIANGLSAGTYCVNVTDNNGCIASVCTTITQPVSLTGVASGIIDATCNSVCNGSATISISGGISPYTYMWQGGGTTATKSNLCAGTYNVTVTDANGCGLIVPATINQPTALSANTSPSAAACNGACSGSVSGAASGGTSPYSYLWSDASTSQNINGICAGNFSITITDANGCTATSTGTVNEPAAISVSTSTTNASCGNANGTAAVTASGGVSPYSFLWQNAQTSSTATGMAAGTYSVTVTDANGCTQTATANVSNSGAPTVSIINTIHVTCFGGNNGSAEASVSGGTSPYTFLWAPSGGTNAIANGLSTGMYSVTVTDNTGCSASANVTINQPGSLGLVVSSSANISCYGLCDGSAIVSASGGTSPYTYLWQSGGTTVSNNSLCAGSAAVSVTDANGCIATTTVSITEPALLNSAITGTNSLCNGNCSGSANLTVSGGTAPYSYSWSNSSATEDLSSICSGNYSVSVTDDNGCTSTSNVVISEPPAMVLTPSTTNSSCGQSNGQVCITASGGVSGYTYSWSTSPTQTTACASAVAAGSYTVTVTDANGCVSTNTVIVNNSSAGTASATINSNATGAGLCNGSATASITGGASPYTYSWSTSPVQTSATATGLCAGSNCVTITDANGCTSTACALITEPTSISATATPTGVQCYGNCSGSINLNVSGGVTPYAYLWDNGATAEDVSALCAGSYTVTVTDANGITVTANAVITSPTEIVVTPNPNNLICNAVCNGSVTITITGGTEPYTYLWSSGQTTMNITGLCAGVYEVTVTDNFGCTGTATSAISEPPAISLTFNTTNANCGANDGVAVVSVSGGTSPYTYQWSAGGNSNTQTGIAAGTYVVSVTDANNCPVTGSVVVNNNSAGIPSAIADFNVTCNGGNDGQATATITGGASPYTYKWSTTPIQTTQIATGLSAGTYSVTITDANCAVVTSVDITQPPALTATVSGVDAGCYGSCDGSGSTSATGGTTPYFYQWNDGNFQTSSSASGLCIGSYSVTVSDTNGCSVISSITISQNPEMILSGSSTQSTCNQSDGTAGVTIASGTAPYSYLWDAAASNQTSATATGLSANCYSVTVTDGDNCTKVENICVTDAGAPGVSILTQTDASCFNSCDGFAQISVSGGNPPYTYSWNTSPAQNTASAFDLCAGTYTGTMVDATGCTASISVTISQPGTLNIIAPSQSNASCNAQCNGSINTVTTGGTTPYSYQWNDGNAQSTPAATGLCAGSYSLLVTDANLCDTSITATISEPAPLTASAISSSAFCNTSSGSACVSVSGGNPGYNYLWDDLALQTDSCAVNLAPGSYSVTVTDANNCTVNASAVVGNVPSGIASITGTVNASCPGTCDGQATVSIGGSGASPFTYQWAASAGNQSTITASGLCAGNHDVTITDANGCTALATAIINNPAPLTITSQLAIDVACFGQCSGSTNADANGGTLPYSYLWNDPLNQTGKSATGLCAGNYTVTITDAAGCTISTSLQVNEPSALSFSSSSLNANCNQSNGSGCVIVSGGTSPYYYLWPSGNINPCASALAAGSYLVTVTDGNGCVKNTTVSVQNINGPNAIISSQTNIDCNGNCNGSLTATVSGGIVPYNFIWSANANNQITPTASNLCAGMYSVTITDSAGCAVSVSSAVTEPATMTYNQQQVNPLCNGDCNGSASVSLTGGTTPYSFLWSDSQTNDTASGLCPGNYLLTITDANSCYLNLNYNLANPAQITTSANTIDATCFGTCDGKAIVTVANGQAPYSYQWNDINAQTSQQAFGLCAGNYSVTITDSKGCTGTATTTVNEPTAISSIINNYGNITCSGQCNGYAQVSVTGGSPAYTYAWSNSAISQVNSNLCAGNYSVTVTDANSCTATASITIVQPVAFSSSISGTNVSCGGACDGLAALSPSGGAVPYTYLWSANANFQNTSTATALCGGNYSVTITDANGCQIYKNINIFEPTPLGLIINNKSDANCGQNNGFICTSVTGGTAPYSYQWNDPNTQTAACATALYAGCYMLNITDAAGCVSDSLICINDIAGPTIAIDTAMNVTCFGANNGTIDFNVTGGITPYGSIYWYDGAGNLLINDTGLTISNTLNGGTYTLVVTDAAGCISSLSQGILEPNQIVSAVTTVTNVTCNGNCNGNVTVGVAGGSMPYTYNWTGGQSSPTATGLCAGMHSLTVTDAKGCTKIQVAQVTEPTSINVSSAILNVSCKNSCDGGISLTSNGGTTPYFYSWSPAAAGPNDASAFNLCSGTYLTSITDANGCQVTQTNSLVEPTPVSASYSVISSSCSNCNGQATALGTGGNSPYNYSWGTGQVGSNATSLCPGNNMVSVTDMNGCLFDTIVIITDSPGPQITGFTVIQPSCNGMNNGSATVSYSGGTGNLSITWSNGQTGNPTLSGLSVGTYSVVISDANNCTISQSVLINQPPAITAVGNGSDTICYGETTQIWASGSGGTPPYNVNWTGSASNLTGIGPHLVSPTLNTTYNFTIADTNNCTANGSIQIAVTPQLSISITTGDSIALCYGDSALICAQAQGGNGDEFVYLWNNGLSDTTYSPSCQMVNPQLATNYSVIVTDGCSVNDTDIINVIINTLPQVDFSAFDTVGCPPLTIGFTSSVIPSGINVNYQWDFNEDGIADANSASVSQIYEQSGTYDVSLIVTTAENCADTMIKLNYINSYPTPVAGFTANPTEASVLNPDIDFDASELTVGADSIVSWDFGDNTSGSGYTLMHHYNDTGEYLVTLTVVNQYGCSSDTSQVIKIKDDFAIFVPNAFSPNKDGKNDYFFPEGVGINPDKFKMWIFDRWGDIIFETNNINTPWDGTAHGGNKPVQIGVYVWLIETENDEGVKERFIGHVTVYR